MNAEIGKATLIGFLDDGGRSVMATARTATGRRRLACTRRRLSVRHVEILSRRLLRKRRRITPSICFILTAGLSAGPGRAGPARITDDY